MTKPRPKKSKAIGLSEAECADRCQDRCAGLTDAQSCVLKDLAVASREIDDGWCTEKQIWPTPSAREFASLKALATKLLVEIRSTQHGALYRLTADGHARLPPKLRLRTPLPISRQAASPLSFDPQRMAKLKRSAEPATAIAVRPAPAAIVDAASTPADDLTPEERKALARCEAEFERGSRKALENFVAMGRALREIRDSRLYRRTHATFEAYLADRCGLRKTSGYELIDGSTAYELAQPIAAKLNLQFTAPAQLRPLAKLESKTEMQDVLRRAARNIEPDRHGHKVPTMVGLEQAVRDSTATVDYTPQQLRKDAQQRRWDEADRKRQAKAAESLGAHQEPDEPGPGTFAGGITPHVAAGDLVPKNLAALGTSDEWHAILLGTPSDGSLPGWWRGEPRYYAPQLVGLREIFDRLIHAHSGQHDEEVAFRRDLARLLDQARRDAACVGWRAAEENHEGRKGNEGKP